MNARTGVAVAAFVAVLASSAMADALRPSTVATVRASAICDTEVLAKPERKQCREMMRSASSDAQRAQLRAMISAKIKERQSEAVVQANG